MGYGAKAPSPAIAEHGGLPAAPDDIPADARPEMSPAPSTTLCRIKKTGRASQPKQLRGREMIPAPDFVA
jgi:hypothetical protein